MSKVGRKQKRPLASAVLLRVFPGDIVNKHTHVCGPPVPPGWTSVKCIFKSPTPDWTRHSTRVLWREGRGRTASYPFVCVFGRHVRLSLNSSFNGNIKSVAQRTFEADLKTHTAPLLPPPVSFWMAVILVSELMQWHDAVSLLAAHELLYHWPLATVSKVTAMLPNNQ